MIKLPDYVNRKTLLNDMEQRYRHYMDLYADDNVTDEQLYEELCASVYSGDPDADFDGFRFFYNNSSLSGFSYKGYSFEIEHTNGDKSVVFVNSKEYALEMRLVPRVWTWEEFDRKTVKRYKDELDEFINLLNGKNNITLTSEVGL